jgi:hypothetical protein
MRPLYIILKVIGLVTNVTCASWLFIVSVFLIWAHLGGWMLLMGSIVWFGVIYFGYLHDFEHCRTFWRQTEDDS